MVIYARDMLNNKKYLINKGIFNNILNDDID